MFISHLLCCLCQHIHYTEMFSVSTLSVNVHFMTPSKTNYHHGNLRTTLIEQTAEMITENGLESVTMRALSQSIGVSRTAAYRHFSDKTELLCAVAEEGFIRFAGILKSARTDQSLDIKQQFHQMGSAYVKFALENPAFYRIMFRENQIDKEQSSSLKSAAEAAFLELVQCLADAQKAGLIKQEELNFQASFVWATMHGLSSLIIDQKLQFDEDQHQPFLDFMKNKILAGLQN